jgi:hypothetical protein
MNTKFKNFLIDHDLLDLDFLLMVFGMLTIPFIAGN